MQELTLLYLWLNRLRQRLYGDVRNFMHGGKLLKEMLKGLLIAMRLALEHSKSKRAPLVLRMCGADVWCRRVAWTRSSDAMPHLHHSHHHHRRAIRSICEAW